MKKTIPKISLMVKSDIIIIDQDDYELIKGKSLAVHKAGEKKYAYIMYPKGYKESPLSIPLHRFLTKAKKGECVHHKDGNGLNDSKDNLILCKNFENSISKKKTRGKWRYKGISVRRTSLFKDPIYSACFGYKYKRLYLGNYKAEEDAAVAYDLAALKYRDKEHIILNFSDKDYSNMNLEQWRHEKAYNFRYNWEKIRTFIGVYKKNLTGEFYAVHKHKSCKNIMGPFKTVEEAATAYDKDALITNQERYVKTNFPKKCYIIKKQEVKVESDSPPLFNPPICLPYTLSMSDMARTVDFSRSRFYQLIDDGFFPKPKKEEISSRPYFDRPLINEIFNIMQTRIGKNGRPLLIYKKRKRKDKISG